jgi:hypothetical protein
MPIDQISLMFTRKDTPAGAEKQSQRKWKWKKNVENESIREMCLVEKIIHTNPTR